MTSVSGPSGLLSGGGALEGCLRSRRAIAVHISSFVSSSMRTSAACNDRLCRWRVRGRVLRAAACWGSHATPSPLKQGNAQAGSRCAWPRLSWRSSDVCETLL